MMSKKIHILHVTATLDPCGGTPVKLLYQVMNSSSHIKFTVCCILVEGDLADKFREVGVEVIELNRQRNFDVRQLTDIMGIVRSRKIDIVHTHFARSNIYSRLAAFLSGKPAIVSEHGIIRNTSFPVVLVDNLFNLFTSHLVANSYATLKSIQKSVYFNRGNMSVIHNGIPDIKLGEGQIPKEKLRQEYGFKENDFIILNVGSHIPSRDHMTLIKTTKKVRTLIPNIKVVQIGDGKDHGSLMGAIKDKGLEKIFFLWGKTKREDVHKFLPVVDVYVNSAILEGFGIATVEAMLCERPVICANSGSLPELITHDEDGLLFEVKNANDLSEKIMSLYESKELRARLGNTARENVLKKFSIKQFVESFEEKYLSTCS